MVVVVAVAVAEIIFKNDKDPYILHIQYFTMVTDDLATQRSRAPAVTNTKYLAQTYYI